VPRGGCIFSHGIMLLAPVLFQHYPSRKGAPVLKSKAPLFVLLALSSSIALAQPAKRELLIENIETEYVSTEMFSSDSPVLNSILAPAMTANPGTPPETWHTVKVEVAAAVAKMFTEKGSPLDVLVRNSLESLSDKELKTLSQLLSDPTYKKFQAGMSSPSAQQQMSSGMAKAGLQLGPLINTILASHHLKEAH
jgi:hypothetical protein